MRWYLWLVASCDGKKPIFMRWSRLGPSGREQQLISGKEVNQSLRHICFHRDGRHAYQKEKLRTIIMSDSTHILTTPDMLNPQTVRKVSKLQANGIWDAENNKNRFFAYVKFDAWLRNKSHMFRLTEDTLATSSHQNAQCFATHLASAYCVDNLYPLATLCPPCLNEISPVVVTLPQYVASLLH